MLPCRYFRHRIGQNVRLRLTPKVKIIHDHVAEDNERLAAYIDYVSAQDRARQAALAAAQDDNADPDPSHAAQGAEAHAPAAFDGADADFDFSEASGSEAEYDSDHDWAADGYESADSYASSSSAEESDTEQQNTEEPVIWVTENGKRVDTRALIAEDGGSFDFDSDSDDDSGLQAYLASLPDADPAHDEMELQRRQNEWAQAQAIRRKQKTRQRRLAR